MTIKMKQIILNLTLLCSPLAAQEPAPSLYDLTPADVRVLSATEPGHRTLRQHLDSLIFRSWQLWQADFEASPRSGRESKYREMQIHFLNAIGGLPQRAPLNARITGVVARSGYRVEKVLLESQPGFHIAAALFLPDQPSFNAPYPAVVIPCGHHAASKAHDEYQSMAALCALNGMAALIYDPVDQGERLQFRSDRDGEPTWGTRAHNLSGIRSILLGENIARYEIWDGMTVIDYLQSRPDIDPRRIGATGNSGGGTQTSQLMALDHRIRVAAPSCYLHHLASQTRHAMGDAEQNIFGQLRFGMDHPDYVLMNAPRPVIILAATYDFFRIDAVWESYRYLKRFYTDIGFAENIDLLENDAGHNYDRTQRQAAARWLARHLRSEEKLISEPDLHLLSAAEIQAAPAGGVLALPGEKSVHDLQKESLSALDRDRHQFLKNCPTDSLRDKVRNLIGCSRYQETEAATATLQSRVRIREGEIEKLILTTGSGIDLPALHFLPHPANEETVLLISEAGKTWNVNRIAAWMEKGTSVLAVDLSGLGELREFTDAKPMLAKNIGWDLCYSAYLLGESIVGLRAAEILSLIKYLESQTRKQIRLAADGEPGVAALHAVFLAPKAVAAVEISGALASWHDVVASERSLNQLPNAVHGALAWYDLPDLVQRLGRRVRVQHPAGAVPHRQSGRPLPDVPECPGLAGIFFASPDFRRPESPDPVESLDMSWGHQHGKDWSAEWFGFLQAPADGPVHFHASTNQAVELLLDERPLLAVATGEKSAIATREMKKGAWYRFKIRYSQNTPETTRLRIEWTCPGQPALLLGGRFLRHSQRQRLTMDAAIE